MFKIGDQVRKIEGYPFAGKIVTVYENGDKCNVKHVDGWEHIFRTKQLSYDYDEFQYLDLLKDCVENGEYRIGRNGGTFGLFGRQIRFDLRESFPLLTTKKIHTKSVVGELLWMLRGETNNNSLQAEGITIWDEWAKENGDLGPIYGHQWRSWTDYSSSLTAFDDQNNPYRIFNEIDQILNVIDDLKKDPYSRRHIVTAWNPAEIHLMALPPCHCFFQFFVNKDNELSCHLYQRSADIFLGVPFNIASYALLTHIIAREARLKVGDFVHTFGDVHLYENHLEAAKTQLSRMPTPPPYLRINESVKMEELQINDIVFHHYHPADIIKAPVSK
jgi:thymidylate synthase